MNFAAAAFFVLIAVFTAAGPTPAAVPSGYVGMVYVEPGEFTMGADEGFTFEGPRHIVYLKGFYMDKSEVTNGQYKIYIDASGAAPPSNWKDGKIPPGAENLPVTRVSYYDALGYAMWAGKRLPAEEEWEKAARGKDSRIFPWGNEWEGNAANVRPLIGFSWLEKIDSHHGGVSPCGCHDMAGNAWEWTSSWFEPYPGNIEPNASYGKKFKVIRGGSYKSTRSMSRTYAREIMEPASFEAAVGFRCVKD
jgi:iron(II)-dependent oxidoreductase